MTDRFDPPGGLRIGVGIAVAFTVVALNAGWIARDLGFLHPPRAVLETDHYRYIEMSKGAGADAQLGREAPFCYRVLVPGIVHVLTRAGVDRNAAFYALTVVCLIGYLVAFWVYLASFGFALRERVLGVVLVGTLPGAVRWYAYQYWMTDPLALLLVTLAFLLIRLERTRWLFALALVGVAARETFLVVVPYYLVHLYRTSGPTAVIRRGLGFAALALAAWVALRAAVPAADGAPWLALAGEVGHWRLANLFHNQLYFVTLGSFGAVLVLLAAMPRRTAADWRAHYEIPVVVAAAYASLLLARNTDRLLVYALPVMVPTALANLRWLVARVGVWGPALVAATLLAQSVFYVTTKTAGYPAISIRQPYSALVTATLALLCTALVVSSRLRAHDSGGDAVG